MRPGANLEARPRRLRHPRRQAGECAVGLKDDDELHAAAMKPAPDEHGLTKARMKPIRDPAFRRLFVGSMEVFRAEVEPREDCLSAGRSALPSCV